MNNEEFLSLDFTDDPSGMQINRREFLKLGGGIFVLFTIGDADLFAQERQGRPSLPTDFNAFLRIAEDGRVSCYTGKIEMGQGVNTSLARTLADELDVSPAMVEMVMGDTDLCPWDRGTFGSMTTRFFGPALRSAAAEARHVMLELASGELEAPIDMLIVENGVIIDKRNKNNFVSYAKLARGRRIERHATGSAPKKMSDFRYMGLPANRKDGWVKVSGEAKYAGDIRVPGMLYARILRPPAHGAKLVSVDVSEAKSINGIRVIQEGDFVAVLHEKPDIVDRALSRIRAKFSPAPSNLDDKNIFDHLVKSAPQGQVVAKNGDVDAGEKASAMMIEQTYLDGYKAHAPMEPHTALVSIEGDKATVWASTQTPFSAKEEAAKEIGLKPEQVRVITPFVGGGFGGKSRNIQVVEAAKLAKLSGKPVQVAWTRKEEFFYDSFRPAAVVKIRSGLNGDGRITFWDYHVYFAGERGSQHYYDIPHHSTSVHGGAWMGGNAHPFATGPWRAPANNTNTFARESQIETMAAKAGVDPLEFRLHHLKDEQMKRVLRTAADKFGWKPSKGPSGRGFGIACGIDAGTYVATFAEAEVDKASGKVQVKRVVCAQDMGFVINPEGATIQMEGCITMGLGYTLKEDIHFKNGQILDTNFDSYEIPRFSWLPKIETILIDNKNADPQGGGEPAIVTMGAVVANAIWDAVGVRVFQLPMTPERVKEAMERDRG